MVAKAFIMIQNLGMLEGEVQHEPSPCSFQKLLGVFFLVFDPGEHISNRSTNHASQISTTNNQQNIDQQQCIW